MEMPRRAYSIKRIRGDVRDDFLLLKIDPPLTPPKEFPGNDIDRILVATRHADASLFPIDRWPVYVFVLRILVEDPERRDVLHNDELELIAWAALYRTRSDAKNKAV